MHQNSSNIDMIDMTESFFAELLFQIDTEFDEYQVAVIADDRWEKPLPDNLPKTRLGSDGPIVFIISISGWTRENSYYDQEPDGLFIKTAFGEEENSAFFPHEEVMGLLDMTGHMVYVKTYSIDPKGREHDNNDAINLPEETPEMKKSMEILLKNNPHLAKEKNA